MARQHPTVADYRRALSEIAELKSWNFRQGETIIRLLNEKQALLKELSREK